MFRRYTFIAALLLCALGAQGCGDSVKDDLPDEDKPAVPETDWNAAAEKATQSLILHFWNSGNGYFNFDPDKADGPDRDWSYWPEAHAMDVIVDGFIRTGGSPSYKSYYEKWYEGVKLKSGGSYYNTFYDDMEWICLTMIRLYETSRESKYLQTARDLWNDIKTGWNEQGGGGVAWTKDRPWSKNACSNGPAGLIAMRLYGIQKNEADLVWAKKIFEWEYDHLYDPATGKVFDNLNAQTGAIQDWLFTYNQGTFLGLAHELWKVTNERMYLNIAVKSASFTLTGLSENGVLKSEGTGDGGLFKGVFVRYFVKLIQDEGLTQSESKRFASFLDNCANSLWTKGIISTDDPLFGPDWSRNDGNKDLGTHVSGAALLEAKALLERNKTGK